MKLLLIPTAFERERLSLELRRAWTEQGNKIELCGFGMAIAGITTAMALQRWNPTEVVLLGIAGAYAEDLPIGSSVEFSRVTCYGVGVGTGESFVSAGDLNWHHWTGPPEIADRIDFGSDPRCDAELLTVASAASDSEEVKRRMAKHPAAIAEDMEGFSVAAACRLTHIPLRIVRGISNRVGDRDHRHWEIERSLDAAMAQVLETNT
ncbi:futalosine hydrolase [Pirellulaceae bacterium SH467]